MTNSRGEQVFVEREHYERNGRRYFSYFVSGTIRGKDVRVAVTPPDKGGYAVLDIVFGEENRVALVAKPYEIKDETTGRVVSGNTYAVRSWDEDGEVYECTVKPAKPSDKSLLNMLVKRA